jgi:hypothetical protein
MPNQPHPDRTKITIFIPKVVKVALKEVARRRHSDFSKVCNTILGEWIAEYSRKRKKTDRAGSQKT